MRPTPADVVLFIQTFIEEYNWPPTRREIAAGLGIPLERTQRLVVEAAQVGWLEVGHTARQVRITHSGAKLLQQKFMGDPYGQF